MNDAAEFLPIDPVLGRRLRGNIFAHEVTQIHGPQVADVVREQRDAAGVDGGGLVGGGDFGMPLYRDEKGMIGQFDGFYRAVGGAGGVAQVAAEAGRRLATPI